MIDHFTYLFYGFTNIDKICEFIVYSDPTCIKFFANLITYFVNMPNIF